MLHIKEKSITFVKSYKNRAFMLFPQMDLSNLPNTSARISCPAKNEQDNNRGPKPPQKVDLFFTTLYIGS